MKKFLVPILFSLPLLAHADSGAFVRSLIQGDVVSALKAPVEGKNAVAAQCIRERFAHNPAPQGGTGGPVIDAYRRYWHRLLLHKAGKQQAEARLLRDLAALVPGKWDRKDIDEASRAAKAHLEKKGLFALTGVTQPYYELMVWKSSIPHAYSVELPERSIQVKVVMLDDWISRGWLNYASCARVSAGGWTADGTLYAMADRYDTASEEFRVGYLAHEGQHFADNEIFPRLGQPELEYRAKLTQIILSPERQSLLEQFISGAQAGRRVPHAHAEYWLAQRLMQYAGKPELGEAARALLLESSAQARAAGAATVTRFLPD